MEKQKEIAIRKIVDVAIDSFANGLYLRHKSEVDNPNGVINSKRNNCFIAELGEEFMFYSAFVRSFDSSFGNLLEKLGNSIAELSYEVRGEIDSYILPEQTQRIATLIDSYTEHHEPVTEHYESFLAITPNNIESFKRCHQTDNYFYKKSTNSHYLIELKASGDLDNKKAKAEKTELLNEFFMLKNKFKDDKTAQIKILFGTAYNKFGEGNPWKQERVKQYFAEDELLIGRDYWNFVCDDDNGFEVVFAQYKESASSIKSALSKVKELYF